MTDAEKHREANNRYYARNKERILAKKKEREYKLKTTSPDEYSARNRKNYLAWKANNPNAERDIRSASQQDISYVAYRILYGMKKRSIDRGWEWNDDWWTRPMIEQIIATQQCCVTRLPFVIGVADNGKSHPFKPSPDRIDNTRGYHPTNVRFVVWMYNQMKSAYSTDYVDVFVAALIKNASVDQEKVCTEDIVGH